MKEIQMIGIEQMVIHGYYFTWAIVIGLAIYGMVINGKS